MASETRIAKEDVRRAFERHLEVVRAAGVVAPHAALMVSSPGDRFGTRYEPINLPTLSCRTYCGARAAYDAFTAATHAVLAVEGARRAGGVS